MRRWDKATDLRTSSWTGSWTITSARGGIVVAIKEKLDIPVKFIGLGEFPEDIARFNADEFVDALFG